MSKGKNKAWDIMSLYRDGYTVLAIARQLSLSTKDVYAVINLPKHKGV